MEKHGSKDANVVPDTDITLRLQLHFTRINFKIKQQKILENAKPKILLNADLIPMNSFHQNVNDNEYYFKIYKTYKKD